MWLAYETRSVFRLLLHDFFQFYMPLLLQKSCHASQHDSLVASDVTLNSACCDAQQRTGTLLTCFAPLVYVPSSYYIQKPFLW